MTHAVTEADIRTIYLATIDTLYRFVARRSHGDRDLAEDVTQETWLRAVRAWQGGRLPDQPAAWLTTVARNLLANHYRRRPQERLDDLDEGALMADEPDASEERGSLVHRALARLPLANSRLLQAFHFRRQPVAHIAAEYGLTERAVEGRLRRARQQLRQQIESLPNAEGEEP